MNKNLFPFMNYGIFTLLRDAAGEGGNGGGGDDAAAKKAKADADAAAAAKAAEDEAAAQKEAEDKAKADAETAQQLADESGTDDAKQLAKEKADLLREVMDKKEKLKAAEAGSKEANEKLAAYEGVDPAKVKELIQKEKDAEKAELEARGEFDRLREVMKEEHGKEKQTLQEQLDAMREENSKMATTIDDLTIGSKFSSSSFISENLIISPNKARQLYGDHFEMKDGNIVAYDKPAGKANRTQIVDGSGDAVGFEEALRRIIDKDADKDSLMKAKAKPGSSSASQAGRKQASSKPADNGLFGRSRIAAGLLKTD